MTEEQYPIHPVLDQLIQSFKQFSTEEFPRGVPAPIEKWRPILQSVTQYEAKVVPQISDYLGGRSADLMVLQASVELKNSLSVVKIQSTADSDYLAKIKTYVSRIEGLCLMLNDCAVQLGNPCKQFKN